SHSDWVIGGLGLVWVLNDYGFILRATTLLYPNKRRNSSADFAGPRNKSDITATQSAPASITDLQFPRLIPPIATSSLDVDRRAWRTPANPTTGSGFFLLDVSNTGPMAT